MFEVVLEDNREDDCRTDLVIYYNSKEILRESDGGEPYFCRDFKWIKPALDTAYTLGRADEHEYLIDQLEI